MTPGVDADIRVVVCDDHALFRRGLVKLLDETDDLEVVAEASGGVEAVELASALAPDVVLMDVQMPGVGGIDATRLLVEARPTTRVLMLSVSDAGEDLLESVKAGAVGYLLKDRPLAEVVDAVREAAYGHSFVTPAMAAQLMAAYADLARRTDTGTGRPEGPRLSATELEVLELLADGADNRDIASRLLLTQSSVKNHVANILGKLQLHTRTEAVLYAVRERLVDP